MMLVFAFQAADPVVAEAHARCIAEEVLGIVPQLRLDETVRHQGRTVVLTFTNADRFLHVVNQLKAEGYYA